MNRKHLMGFSVLGVGANFHGAASAGLRVALVCLLAFAAVPMLMAQEAFTVAPPNGTFTAVGGSFDFTVSAPVDESWAALSTENWLTVVAGATGTGPGTVRVTAATNETTDPRTAQLIVGPFTVFLVQDPLFATIRFLPNEVTVGPSGALRSITVVVDPANLPWQATSNVSWIDVTTARDVGSGQVSFAVAANPTPQTRVGVVSVLGNNLTVTQTGSLASFSLSSPSVSLPFAGGTGEVAVTATPESTVWVALALQPWIQVSSNQFTGSGTVGYTVAPNFAKDAREGSIRIADSLFRITQAGNPDAIDPTDPTPPSSTFSLSTGIVSITSRVGSTLEVSQALAIASTGEVLNFDVEVEDAPWLRARRTSGTTPDTIIFTATPTGLAVGTYFGTIRLRSTSNTAVLTLPARLRINPPPGTPEQPVVSPSSLFFSRITGGMIPDPRTVRVGRPGELPSLQVSLQNPVPWLQVSSSSNPTGSFVTAAIRSINMLPGLYEAVITVASPSNQFASFTIPVSYRVQTPPMNNPYISSSGIVHAASFEEGFGPNTWMSIFGENLAKSTRTWSSGDFQGGNLPLSLDGVEVTVGGSKAAISFISPTQINILSPALTALGRKEIVVTVDGVPSESGVVYLEEVFPAFFTFGPMSGKYAAALHLDSAPVGPADLFASGTPARPAKPGEVLQVFGSGFGATNPPADPTRLLTTPAPLIDFESLEIRIGGMEAAVGFSGLSATGLNQFNVTVPTLPEGDHEIVARIGNAVTRTGVFIHVKP